jgi:hypothetical protein
LSAKDTAPRETPAFWAMSAIVTRRDEPLLSKSSPTSGRVMPTPQAP